MHKTELIRKEYKKKGCDGSRLFEVSFWHMLGGEFFFRPLQFISICRTHNHFSSSIGWLFWDLTIDVYNR